MSMSTDSSSISCYELARPESGLRVKTRSDGKAQRDVVRVVLLFTTLVLSCLLVYKSVDKPLQEMLPQRKAKWYSQNQTSLEPVTSINLTATMSQNRTSLEPLTSLNLTATMSQNRTSLEPTKPVSELERVLKYAAMEDNTVIITALNNAWATPNSTFDLFLESFQTGLGTKRLLKHVIAVCLDWKAYERCLVVHYHCYLISATDSDELAGRNKYMSPNYLKLVWRRMDLLREVLGLGYNFLFTDADILWFRDPFPRFYSDVDFQMSCDMYNGIPSDRNNLVNSGVTYVKANNKTRKFYDYWCDSRKRFPGKHDQDVFNSIKNEIYVVVELGVTMRFLDTVFFGGFCQPSRDINVVNTMHANCCVGLDNKVKNLKAALDDWKQYLLANKTVAETKWNIPPRCGY